MKYIYLVVALAFFVACNEQSATQPPVAQQDSTAKPETTNAFTGVDFAVNKDLSCGMPLTAGLEDTAHYKGKIYGFCSAECKADFEKNAAVYVQQAAK
ncbi:MAG: YHS domain-containing protein [Chitinophagaceae bacterium]